MSAMLARKHYPTRTAGIEYLLKAGWKMVTRYQMVYFVDILPQRTGRLKYQDRFEISWMHALRVQKDRKYWTIRLFLIRLWQWLKFRYSCAQNVYLLNRERLVEA